MTDDPRPAQPEPQFRSAFSFAPPTAPIIPLATTKDVFIFGATAQSTPSSIAFAPASSSATLSPSLSSLTSSSSELSSSSLSGLLKMRSMARRPKKRRDCALHRSANLSVDPRSYGIVACDRPKVTTQSDRSKLRRARCKLDCPVPCLGLLQPDTLLCPMDDSSVEDSEQASVASTVPLLITLLSLLRGSRPDLPRHRRRKVRDGMSNWQLPQFSTTDTDFGKHHRQPRVLSLRCTRAQMKALGRSRWLNGLCRSMLT